MGCSTRATRWRIWLRHYVTNQKVGDLIPGCVIEIFRGLNPPSFSMAVASSRPVTEMNTRYISCEVKAAGA